MNEDEQIDLVTLAWLGRGDGDAGDWNELRAEAVCSHNKRTATYLLGMPLLSDYLGPSRISISLARILSATGSEVICDLARKSRCAGLGEELRWTCRGEPLESMRDSRGCPVFVSAKRASSLCYQTARLNNASSSML